MGMKIKYIGPKDGKRYAGQYFPRLLPVEVSDAKAAELLAFPTVFMPADQDVPHEILSERNELGNAMIREGEAHKESYLPVFYAAQNLKKGALDEKTGKPNAEMQKRLDTIAGAQSQLDYAEGLIKQGNAWNERLAAEKANGEDLSPTVKRGRKADEALAV